MGPTDEQREAFQSALSAELSTAGRKAVIERLDISRALLSGWSTGKEGPPRPDQIFEIEDALGLPGGTLSRHLGYVPVGASSVPSAIDSDPKLIPSARKHLEAVYRTMLSWVDS